MPSIWDRISLISVAGSCGTGIIENCGAPCQSFSTGLIAGVQDIYDQYKQIKDLSKVNYNQATLRAATTAVIAGLLNSGLSFSKFSLSSSALLGAKLAWLRPNLFANLMTLTRAERTQLADALQSVSEDVLTRLENPTFFADFSKAILVSGSTPSSGILSSVSRVQSWVNSWLGIKDKALKWVRSTTLTGTLGIMTLTGTPQVEARIIDNSSIIETVMRVPNVASGLINGNSSEISSIVSQASVVAEVNASQILDQTGEALSSSSGTYEILQSTINSVQNILVRLKTSSTTSTQPIVLIKDGKTYKIGDDSKCVYCGKTVLKPASGGDNTEYTLCQDLNTLQARGGTNGTAGVAKLCSAFPTVASLRPIVTKLLNFTSGEVQAFLGDITKTYTSGNALNQNTNIASLNTDLIDAWKVVYDARNTITSPGGTTRQAHRCDIAVLKEIVKIKTNTPYGANFMRLEGIEGLKTFIRQNTRLPCNPCYTYANGDHLNDLENYLQDLIYLANTCSNNISGCSSVTAALKSTAQPYYRVEPEAFVIRVLRQELWANKVVAFEASMLNSSRIIDVRINDNGTTVNCEFKSWSKAADNEVAYDDGENVDASKSPFDNLVAGKGSYGQFRDYLKGIGSMSELRYYFDAKKGVTEDYAKGKFQQMLQNANNQTEIFNTIFANTALRGNLIPQRPLESISQWEIRAKNEFTTMVNSLSESFFKFIKVK